ncbi:serine/threonine protein kinase [Actinomadura luteofluorescens]|uniref:serine/threonine protein kinase n=1 Tax=Actinomadura luteofluorescens TaxID=46163 RepID=UPI003635B34E
MMVTTPNVIVAGHPDLARRLRGTGRFPAVFDAASASGLRDLSKSGEVRAPAAFLFAPDFDEDLPGAGVPFLADRLAASGHTVVVHGFFTERGDVFAPEVIATAKPLTLKELLELLGAARPESPPASAGTTFTWPSDGPPPELRVSAAEAPPAAGAGAGGARANDSSSLIPGYGGLSMLHRGTGSVTYRAVREDSGAVAAVRVRLDGSETPMDELAALERASRSDHLVSVLESGRATTGQLYTAAVYCPGGAPAPEPMPVGDAVRYAISTGWALQALHDEGLVHGDVRPGRILRGEAGPLLTGAATARGLAAHAAHGVLEPVARERVNPAFAPPEALRQEPQTAQSDVYGLGATLWGLLAGRAPFAADGQRAPDGAVPRVPRDDVPEWLANALGTALANELAARYPTAREFAEALEEGLRAAPPQDGRVAGAPSAPWDKSAPEPDPAPVAASEQLGDHRGPGGALRGTSGTGHDPPGALREPAGLLRGAPGSLRGAPSALRGAPGPLRGTSGAVHEPAGALRGTACAALVPARALRGAAGTAHGFRGPAAALRGTAGAVHAAGGGAREGQPFQDRAAGPRGARARRDRVQRGLPLDGLRVGRAARCGLASGVEPGLVGSRFARSRLVRSRLGLAGAHVQPDGGAA